MSKYGILVVLGLMSVLAACSASVEEQRQGQGTARPGQTGTWHTDLHACQRNGTGRGGGARYTCTVPGVEPGVINDIWNKSLYQTIYLQSQVPLTPECTSHLQCHDDVVIPPSARTAASTFRTKAYTIGFFVVAIKDGDGNITGSQFDVVMLPGDRQPPSLGIYILE